MSDPKPKLRRKRIQAKKALAELEATEEMTMRGDAISGSSYAMDEIEEFLDHGSPTHLREARDALQETSGGAVGDARYHFEKAVEELEAVIDE